MEHWSLELYNKDLELKPWGLFNPILVLFTFMGSPMLIDPHASQKYAEGKQVQGQV